MIRDYPRLALVPGGLRVAGNPGALPEVAALGYRPCPVKGYLFLYRVRGDRVEIAHVFHQSQDYARHL